MTDQRRAEPAAAYSAAYRAAYKAKLRARWEADVPTLREHAQRILARLLAGKECQ